MPPDGICRKSPPVALRLGPDDVHVWHIALDPAAAEVGALYVLLDPDEQARAARFRNPAHGRRFTVAHGALRMILSRYLHQPPDALRIRPDARGKPALAGAPLSFNLSHSHDTAVVAIAARRAVGIDVERPRARPIVQLAARFFAPRERAALAAHPPETQRTIFFALWTGKEAYLKATGDGLVRDLRRIDVADLLRDAPARAHIDGRADPRFALSPLALDAAHAAALAVEGDDATVSGWRWSP